MKTVLPCAVMLLVVLIGAPGYPGPLTLYDDFNAGYIDPDKWFGRELGPEPVVPPGGPVPPPVPPGAGREAGAEAIRQILDGQLRLLYQGYGQRDSDKGRLRREVNLNIQDSAAMKAKDVTAIEATVEVTAVTTNGCPTAAVPDTDYTVAGARVSGRFFSATNSGAKVGDVVALIFLGRTSFDPPNVLHVTARVFHCFDENCTDFAEPLSTPRDLGLPLLPGQKVKLQVQWDKDNGRFIFKRDSTTEVVSYQPTLTFKTDPSFPIKKLSATMNVPNCMPLSPRPVASIDARFDDVMVAQ
jgi:hypothetical protein